MSALQRPQPRPGVLAIDPYVPGKSKAPGVARVFKLSSNETPLGPSPKAVAAYHAVGEHLQDYPDGDSTALREAIGRTFGLDPSRIVCGVLAYGSSHSFSMFTRCRTLLCSVTPSPSSTITSSTIPSNGASR